MATRQLLAELVADYQRTTPLELTSEAVGGVDAARRVQADEPFDLVVLASDAIDKLIAAGKIVPGSRTDIVTSGVAVAVPAGAPHPDLGSEASVRAAVLAAPSIGYSTGPSGVALVRLFEHWGIADQIKDRLQQARPGVPVASMVADGSIALGFQQLSEMLNVAGIDIVGPLPPAIQIVTTFSAGIAVSAGQPDAARALAAFFASPAVSDIKRRNGMAPA